MEGERTYEGDKEGNHLFDSSLHKQNQCYSQSKPFLLVNEPFGRLDFMLASSHMYFGLLADNEIYMRISFV